MLLSLFFREGIWLNGGMKKNRHAPVFRFVMAALCSVLLAACAMGGTRQLSVQMLDEFPLIMRVAEVENVPFIAEKDKHGAPSSLAMMSTWLELPMTQEDAAGLVYTSNRPKMLKQDLVTSARRLGFFAMENADPKTAFLQVSQGKPVIVFLNVGSGLAPVWHYAVLKGYNLDAKTVTLHLGATENDVMPLETFLDAWKRTDYWHMLMTQAGELPAGVTPLDVHKAIAGVEDIEMFDAAADLYRLALDRWPQDFTLRMGFANLLYTQKDYKGAEQQFLQAWKDHPKAHAPLNNLTYALIEQRCYTNAIHAAREALWLAPEKDKPAVQQTLDAALAYHGQAESRTCMKQPVIR